MDVWASLLQQLACLFIESDCDLLLGKNLKPLTKTNAEVIRLSLYTVTAGWIWTQNTKREYLLSYVFNEDKQHYLAQCVLSSQMVLKY